MKTVGIIVEYNPLHFGHVYHFEQSKQAAGADTVIAVMSGHFLQRGEPAVMNKWARAETALAMGADVVLELPVIYATQPAEWFAYGAVAALDATGVVESLCFGSESGDIAWLERLAERMRDEPEGFGELVREHLKRGVSYPSAYSAALGSLADTGFSPDNAAVTEWLMQPNNSLGLHYLIALQRLGSRIRPLTISRQKAGYHQKEVTDARIASATAIRHLLFEQGDLEAAKPLLPSYTYEILTREWHAGRAPMNWERFASPLLHGIASRTAAELSLFHEMTEGLEHRLKQVLPSLPLQSGDTVAGLVRALKTKRYTQTKLQRTLLRILLNLKKEELSRDSLFRGPAYLRVLGFSPKGQELLKKMKKTAKLPLVMKASRENSALLETDLRASAVYALGYPQPDEREMFRDYYDPPLRGSAYWDLAGRDFK